MIDWLLPEEEVVQYWLYFDYWLLWLLSEECANNKEFFFIIAIQLNIYYFKVFSIYSLGSFHKLITPLSCMGKDRNNAI